MFRSAQVRNERISGAEWDNFLLKQQNQSPLFVADFTKISFLKKDAFQKSRKFSALWLLQIYHKKSAQQRKF